MKTDRDLMQQALKMIRALRYRSLTDVSDEIISCLEERLAQPAPVQEPVAWGVFDGPNLHDMFFAEEDAQDMARLKGVGSVVRPLTTPPAAQRKPLTDEQLNEIADRNYSHWVEFARAIEAAHGIKENT